MRDGDIVMLALGSLLGEVGGKGRLPLANEFCSVEKGVAQITRTTLLHVRVSAGGVEFAGLICRRRKAFTLP